MGCIVWPIILLVAGVMWLIPTVGPFLSVAIIGGGIWLSIVWMNASDAAAQPRPVATPPSPPPISAEQVKYIDGERVKVKTINPDKMRIVDLTGLDSMRLRIVGSSYYITSAERDRFGGTSYLLVLEPENPVDPLAVAVYGKGRKVGHLSAKRAAIMHPYLSQMGADAYLVGGKGSVYGSAGLHADLPRIPPLREFAAKCAKE